MFAVWKKNEGSHEGGILSTLLFNFYIKVCIDDIVNHNVGCMIWLIKWNVLAYADNIVVVDPSLKDLQKLSYEN